MLCICRLVAVPTDCITPTLLFALLLQALLDKEVLNLDAVESILGLRPFTSATLQNIDRYRRSSIEADDEEETEGADGAKEGDNGDSGDGSDEEEARKGLDPGMVVAT